MNQRSRKLIFAAVAGVVVVMLAIVGWRCAAGWKLPTEYTAAGRLPRIRPDYTQIVIPPNIAPLNFLVEEPGSEYRVRIYGVAGEEIVLGVRGAGIVIPPRPWRELLRQNRGGRITVDVYARSKKERWLRFDSIVNEVAHEEIDSHLVYRLLGPVCNYYHNMGIYQRDLESYDESPIVTTDAINACFNCHSFVRNRPETFSLQVRAGDKKEKAAAGMVLVRDGRAWRPKTRSAAGPKPPAYTTWHPNGAIAAFALIVPEQCSRGVGAEVRDVLDYDSDLAAMNFQTGAASTSRSIADRARLETFPAWSADGQVLYFSSAERFWDRDHPLAMDAVSKIMYDLVCVRYDMEKDVWGQPETILSARETGMSISQPRASPDGRYLLFCMADYGTFPVYRASSDVYMMDLKSRKYRRLECNSPQSDSWHCWSSNSRWIVFSSKRDTGWLARPYFSYIDAEGRAHKPFVLPQKAPAFYDSWLRTYNVPELITGPVTVSQNEVVRAVKSGEAAGGSRESSTPTGDNPYGPNWTHPWKQQ
jgi:hypothetical protein